MPSKLQSGDEIVPGYILVRRLGAGGSGEVWVARASGGVQVAIKVISDLALIASDRELDALRIVREAKHPNLCPLFGVWFFDADDNLLSSKETESILGNEADMTETVVIRRTKQQDRPAGRTSDDGGTLAIPDEEITKPAQMVVAMGLGEQTLMDRLLQVQAEREFATDPESADSGTPAERVSDAEASVGIDVDELMRYMASSASAIDELNQRHNIYHCDIKPQNILLVGGQAQVCDFGLARKVEDSRQTTIAFGTPAYGAPEMLFERTYSKTIDQYSMAVTYYELRTGKLPYSSVTQSALLRAKAIGEVDLSRIPPAEAKVIARATDLDPKKRYKTCQAMVVALGEALADPDRATEDVTIGQKGRVKPIAATAIALALALAGLFVFRGPLSDRLGAVRNPGEDLGVVDLSGEPRDDAESIPPGLVVAELATPKPKDPELVAPESIEREPKTPETEPPETERPQPESLQPESLQPESLQPEPPQTEPAEPEPAEPEPISTDARVLAALGADPLDATRITDALEIFQLPDADLSSLSNATIEKIIQRMERRLSTGPTPDRATFESIVGLAESIAPIARQQAGDDRSKLARLELIELIAATSIATMSGGQVSDLQLQQVRALFDEENHYAHRPASQRAAAAIASSWLAKFDGGPWDDELAERDIERALELGPPAEADLAAIQHLHSTYLIGLLQRRVGDRQPASFNAATIRIAKELEQDATFGTLARSAIALADPEAQVHRPQRIDADASGLESIPTPLQATYLLGAGWNLWRYNKTAAVDHWKQASQLASIDTDGAPADRHAVARHLLDYTSQRSKVPDDVATELRYHGRADAMGPVLETAHRLAAGDPDLVRRADSERFICSVAGGDVDAANQHWSRVETGTQGNTGLTRQQGRALFDLAISQAESKVGDLDGAQINQLLIGCNAQVDPEWFGPADHRGDRAQPGRNDLFRRCFRPAMEQLRDRINTAERIEETGIDQPQLSLFCERLVTLMTEHDYRSHYGAVVPYLADIELAASIAGRYSETRDQRAQWYFQASHAFIRAIHEEQDDRPYAQWIQTFIEYRDQARKFGTNAYTDCIAGMVAKEEALRETDRERAYNRYAEAIAKFSSAIGTDQEKLPVLIGVARAGRARAGQLAAIMEQGDRQETLLQTALQDVRLAAQTCEGIPAVSEYVLEDLARICCAVSQIPESRPADEKYSLIVEAQHAINEAIAIRKNASLDESQLAISKLFVHWIGTMVITEPPHARATVLGALDWAGRTADIGKNAPSSRLKCHWYFYVAMVQHATGEWELGLNHLVTARQLASRDLEANELITHLITLGYVTLKSNQLEVGSRQEKLRLVDELTRELKAIMQPTPPIASKRDEYLGYLEKAAAEIGRGR